MRFLDNCVQNPRSINVNHGAEGRIVQTTHDGEHFALQNVSIIGAFCCVKCNYASIGRFIMDPKPIGAFCYTKCTHKLKINCSKGAMFFYFCKNRSLSFYFYFVLQNVRKQSYSKQNRDRPFFILRVFIIKN